MIRTDEQLRRTREALLHVEAALAALHRQKAEMHPNWFALMAEPVLDQLHELRAQIDAHIGLDDTTNAVAAVVKANGGFATVVEP
jgi:hypothetical protein